MSDSVWSPLGQLLQQRMGTTWAYFASYTYETGTRRLTGTAVDRQANSGLARDALVTYAYDDAGNPTSITDSAGQVDRQCFSYDGFGRLTSAWTAQAAASTCTTPTAWSSIGGPAPYWQDYTYTAAGNRDTVVSHTQAGTNTATYTYPASGAGAVRPHAVTSVVTAGVNPATAAFTYDDAGNTRSRTVDGTTQQLSWSSSGKLTDVDLTSTLPNDAHLEYDAEGNRVLRADGASTTVYLPGGQELTVTSGATRAVRNYTFAGQPVAVRTGPSNADLWSTIADPHQTVTGA